MRRLPWYSFLYRLFGAHGTFWLWLVCVGVLWWTTKPALIRVSNRSPHAFRVADVQTQVTLSLVRWVQVEGLELRLDGSLLAQQQVLALPVTVLVDAEDPAAEWWRETHALAERFLDAGGEGDARSELIARLTELRDESLRFRALPAPNAALLVQDSESGPVGHGPLPTSGGEVSIEDLLREVSVFAQLVRERVRPRVTRVGVLEAAPVTVQERLDEGCDVHVADYLLQSDRRPQNAVSVVFGLAAITLIFLAAGLIGAVRGSAHVASPPEAEDPKG